MRVLLDTHALVWLVLSPITLGANARRVLNDPATEVFVSSVSVYELSSKVRLGKWPEAASLANDFVAISLEARFNVIPLTPANALLAASFAAEHRDPFDRMLAATAIQARLALISLDRAMDDFAVERIW